MQAVNILNDFTPSGKEIRQLKIKYISILCRKSHTPGSNIGPNYCFSNRGSYSTPLVFSNVNFTL